MLLQPGVGPQRSTAGGFLIRAGSVLIERRADDKPSYPGLLDSPGGHVDPGETPDETLVREMREELGIELEEYFLGMVIDDLDAASGTRYRHFIFGITRWRGEPRAVEGQALRWIDARGDFAAPGGWNPIALRSVLEFRARGWLDA